MSRCKKNHNDIKPANFVVKKNVSMDGFPHNIYLTDFGLAEKMDGTPVFASPECFDESKQKSDIFSLGRVYLFIILSNRDLYLGNSLGLILIV